MSSRMSSRMSWHSSAAACSASTAGAHARPLQSLARRSAAACVPSCGASRLGAAARHIASSVRDPVAAASRETSGSQPALWPDPLSALPAAPPPPRQLLVSMAKPLLLSMSVFLGGRLLGGLPAGSAMQLAGLALAAQALAAAITWVFEAAVMRGLLLTLREQARRRRASKQASRLAAATAQRRSEAQRMSLDFIRYSCVAVVVLSACCLLEAAGHVFGFSIAAAVQHSLWLSQGWAAMGDRPALPLLLKISSLVLPLPAFALFRAWRTRSKFYAAVAERRGQNAAQRGRA